MGLLQLSNGQAAIAGDSGTRISGTHYFASLDASTQIAVSGTILKTDRIRYSSQTGDPGTLVAGDLWFRSDTGKLRYYDGAGVKELTDTSTSGIPNPGTKATNDILQYNGSSWDAAGAASGDPLTGPVYFGTAVYVGANTALKTDRLHLAEGLPGSLAGGDIWYDEDFAHGRLYFQDGVAAVTKTIMEVGAAASGDLSGSYPNPTVAKIQGVSVTASPATNDILQYTGTVWEPKGASSGDPFGGPLYFGGDIWLVGASSKDLFWDTDGGGWIGSSNNYRPDAIYVKTRLNLNSGTSEPASIIAGDVWYQSGHLKYRDGTLARHINPGRLGKKYYSGAIPNASGEVVLFDYLWAAGELDNDRSNLRFLITGVTGGSTDIRIRTYYTTNGGGSWNIMSSDNPIAALVYINYEGLMTPYQGDSQTYYFWRRGLGWTEAMSGGYNTGVSWFAGSGSNYGMRVTFATRTASMTSYVKAWLYEDRTPY